MIDHEWVGIRPSRDPMRVEKETLHFSNGTLKVTGNILELVKGV